MTIFKERREKLLGLMKQQQMEGALIMNPSSIYYLTGFHSNPHERFLGLFLFADEEPVMIAPALEYEVAKSQLAQVEHYSDSDGPSAAIRSVLTKNKVTSLAVEKEYISFERVELLQSIVPTLQFHSISASIQQMRATKDAMEIDILRQAATMVDQVVRDGIARIQRGMTELELAGELEFIAKKLGAPSMSFDTTVLSGAKSAAPHGKPDHSPIAEGEFLLLDLGVVYKGYCSDITRTFIIGEGSAKHKEIYELVLQANERAIAATKAGVALGELDRIARKTIEDGGYGSYFNHRLGHGLGLEVHEYPSVHGDNPDIAKSGLVFTIEPGIYVPGFGGVRIEDDVVVTEEGVEVLTKFPKEWSASIIYFA